MSYHIWPISLKQALNSSSYRCQIYTCIKSGSILAHVHAYDLEKYMEDTWWQTFQNTLFTENQFWTWSVLNNNYILWLLLFLTLNEQRCCTHRLNLSWQDPKKPVFTLIPFCLEIGNLRNTHTFKCALWND